MECHGVSAEAMKHKEHTQSSSHCWTLYIWKSI